MHPEWNLVIQVVAVRHDESQVVRNALVKAMLDGESVRSRELDSRLSFLSTTFLESDRRNGELHEYLLMTF
jgi:hypothetical protein